jgi:hypothetical protein
LYADQSVATSSDRHPFVDVAAVETTCETRLHRRRMNPWEDSLV